MMDLDQDPDNFLNHDEVEAARHEGDNPNEIKFTADDAPRGNNRDSRGGVEPRRRHRSRRVGAVIVAVVLVALAIAVWLRYFNPYVVDAQATGYVTDVERRGVIFKTFEGELIPSIPQTVDGVYSRDFRFSITDDSLAATLQQYQASHRPVTLLYKRYPATLPWRGASTVVVTGLKPAPVPEH